MRTMTTPLRTLPAQKGYDPAPARSEGAEMVKEAAAPTVGEFLWRWVWTAFRRSLGLADAISGVTGALAAFLLGDSPTVMTDLAWQIPVFSLAVAMVARLAVAPYLIWRDEREAVLGLAEGLRPALALVSDPSCPACAPSEPPGHQLGVYRPFHRIGIRNLSEVSIYDVHVRIERLSPSPDFTLPVYLRPVNQQRPVTWSGSGRIQMPAPPNIESIAEHQCECGASMILVLALFGLWSHGPHEEHP
jgi:hypothetical protein